MLDKFILNCWRTFFLVEGLTWGILATVIHNPDRQEEYESRYVSGMMIFDNIEMLPPEYIMPMLWMGRILVVALPIIAIWTIIKPLVFGE